ncbi:DUF4286 family protein [Mycobacterium neglectum]|uniref:DUF4286 family protein n=1 Tax=Mycobacterium neglectum TaxID=242737 RepID=UPI00159BA483|nr:DUF4286 family protein [Mycobacterium neglectum]
MARDGLAGAGKDIVNPSQVNPSQFDAAHPADRRGLLVVMCEPDDADEELLNRWYDDEHLAERVAIPGILSARRYVAVEGQPKYLAMYELDTPAVVQDEPYLEKKRHPTELTRSVEARVPMARFVYAEITPQSAGGPGPLASEA